MTTPVVDRSGETHELQERVRRLEPAALAAVLRRATGRDHPAPAEWDVTPLPLAMGGSTAGLFHVSGQSPPDGPWSVVLKIVRPPAGNFVPGIGVLAGGFGDDPAHYNYWRRETLAYESGLTADVSLLGGGLRAPRFFGRTDDPTGSPDRVWLWLEDVRGTPGGKWTPERYALAARHLGRFNGAYLSQGIGDSPTGTPNPRGGSMHPPRQLPAHDWLSRRWLRSWLTRWEDQLFPSVPNEVWQHPLVELAFPDPARERLQRLWDRRESLLAALERLPQTLAHLDANPGNLFGVPGTSAGDGASSAADTNGTPSSQGTRRDTAAEETVIIDWSFVGVCAVGEELGQLLQRMLAATPAWHARAVELRDALFQSYVQGLRDVGWEGDSAAQSGVRFAYLTHAALRWGLHVPAPWIAKLEHSPAPGSQARPPEERAHQRAFLNHFLLDQADEAYDLLTTIGS